MESKIFRRGALKAALYQCKAIPQILSLLKQESSISDKSTALRVAGGILLRQTLSFKDEKIFELEKDLRQNLTLMKNRDIMNFIYFIRVCRETRGIKREFEFTSSEFSKIFSILNDKSMETTEIIALYYDLKRIKIVNLDEFMIKKLNDENFSMNINQIKIIMRTALNNTTFYNQNLIESCIKRILEIEFNLELNSIVLDLIEILFEINHRLIYFETVEIFEKIENFLKETQLSMNDYLKVLELHRLYNKSTGLLRVVIEKFLQSCCETSDPSVLGLILNICPDHLTKHPLFSVKLIPACIEVLTNSKFTKKNHIIILEGLLPYTHLIPKESYTKLSEKFSENVLKSLFNNSDLLTKAFILRYYSKKTNKLNPLSTVPFNDVIHEPLEDLLKFYTILKTSNLFEHLPGLEPEITNFIKLKIGSKFSENKLFVKFISTQYNPKIRNSLNELISKCLPICQKYYDTDTAVFRTLMALYFNSSTWYESADSYLNTSEAGDCVSFLTNNYTSIANIQGLIHLSKISKSKDPFNLVSIIFLLMHPYAWSH